jgi:hypothetical protein
VLGNYHSEWIDVEANNVRSKTLGLHEARCPAKKWVSNHNPG